MTEFKFNQYTQRNEMTKATGLETLQQLTGADVLDALEYIAGYVYGKDLNNYEVDFVLADGIDAGEAYGRTFAWGTTFDADEEEANEIAEAFNQHREECEAPEDLKIFATIREN